VTDMLQEERYFAFVCSVDETDEVDGAAR